MTDHPLSTSPDTVESVLNVFEFLNGFPRERGQLLAVNFIFTNLADHHIV